MSPAQTNPNLKAPTEADVAKENALARVSEANAVWISGTVEVIVDVARKSETFTSDDIWPRSGNCPEPRAMGAAFRVAQKLGLIVPTAEWRLSTRAECHRRPLRVWRAA